MKIGLFGGSFNPIHKGHIHLAKSVKDTLNLDRIILIPSKKSPHKSNDEYVSNEHRFNMCKLAIQDIPDFEVSNFEFLRDSISYTIYTVEHFKSLYPNDCLYLLIGSDMLLSFDTWKNFQEIMQNVTLAVVSRHNGDMNSLVEKSKQLSEYGEIVLVNVNPVEVSSTQIRKNIKIGKEYSCILDEKVVQYIRLNNLYLN